MSTLPPLAPDLARAIATARAAYPQKAIRIQYGESLLALAAEFPDFLVLTADLMHATGIEKFGARYPGRLINLGIAEQNVTGVATGLALSGILPVVSGYAAFTSLRAIEQAKVDAAYNQAKVILTGQSAGLSYGVGGPTHQTFEDIAIFRAIPNTIVLVPADANEADACLRAAITADVTAPIYIRLGRGPELVHSPPGTPFVIGKAKPLRDGDHLAIIATGSMVAEALIASDVLAPLGIGARVLNVPSLKPIDADAIRAAARGVEAVLVIEEHALIGGLGSAVLECLAETPGPPVRRIGIGDAFPPIGPTHQLRAALGLSAEGLVAQALDLIGEGALRAKATAQ